MGFGKVIVFVLLLLRLGSCYGTTNSTDAPCNLYRGKWVYDQSYPLYHTNTCPFLLSQFTCIQNGRPDNAYLKYRWQPSNCATPKFDGRRFLWENRGKQIMFVGDSLSSNQWQSLACMVHTSAPAAKYTLSRKVNLSIVTFTEYGVSLIFARNALLLDIDYLKGVGRVLRLDSNSRSAEQWTGADVLIFDTWHWWLYTGRKQMWDYIGDGKKLYKNMNRLEAYTRGLITWARWVDSSVDPSKTKIFFQGVSPDHASPREWGARDGGKMCREEKLPLLTGYYRGGPHPAQATIQKVLARVKKPVHLLDITLLSQLRKDAHPGDYGLAVAVEPTAPTGVCPEFRIHGTSFSMQRSSTTTEPAGCTLPQAYFRAIEYNMRLARIVERISVSLLRRKVSGEGFLSLGPVEELFPRRINDTTVPINVRRYEGVLVKKRLANMFVRVKVPSLVDLCVNKTIDNLRYLGDVGETDLHLLERILPHCTHEELRHIENHTERDLSPITDKLWKKLYEKEFGAAHSKLVIERMNKKGVVFEWRQLFEAKLKDVAEAENKAVDRLKQLYKKEDARKQSRQIQLCSKAPPSSNKRSFFGGSGPSYNVSNLKGNLMKKAKIEYLKSHEVKNLAAMKKSSVQRNHGVSPVMRRASGSTSQLSKPVRRSL